MGEFEEAKRNIGDTSQRMVLQDGDKQRPKAFNAMEQLEAAQRVWISMILVGQRLKIRMKFDVEKIHFS